MRGRAHLTIKDHGNCHLLFGSNLAHFMWTAVSDNFCELVLWIGRQTICGFGLLNQIVSAVLLV